MKDLMKYTLGTILGLIAMGVISTVFFILMVVAMAASGASQSSKSIEKGSVMRICLNGTLVERASEDDVFAELFSDDEKSTVALDELKCALKEAADNKNIVGIYLDGGELEADAACRQELRQALLAFKKSGKFIVSYADTYGQGSYYLASVADRVLLNPSGMLDWHGIASEPMFYTELLQKLGVKVQVFKVGTYKSAVEPYILTSMSDANREQVSSFIGDIWQSMVTDVAASRKVTAEGLNAVADDYAALQDPTYYVKKHLVDSLCYKDGVRDVLRRMAKTEKVNFVTPSDVAAAAKKTSASDHVVVYYAEGDIVDAESPSSILTASRQIVGSTIVADLDELASDDDVKAVVLRINSGGGSAYASEQMWRAIQLLKKKKPVVVSMSGMAASGGYYMSCGANYIFADAATLTGSIGIFGMVPDMSGLMTDKLGLHFDVVKTNKSADFGATGRGFNAEESEAMQAHVERGYRLFLTRVADGRHMKVAQVDSIAQGRVWTGRQALAIGLVDKLGTLEDAVAYAAKLAKVKDYEVCTYPEQRSFLDELMDELEGDSYLERKARVALGEYYRPLTILPQLQNGNYLQARIPFEPQLR